jgi:hypothetical protein
MRTSWVSFAAATVVAASGCSTNPGRADSRPGAEGPQDLLNVSGYVIDGRIHAHMTVADRTSLTRFDDASR